MVTSFPPVQVTTVGEARSSSASTSSRVVGRVGRRAGRRWEKPLKLLSASRRSQDGIMEATSEQGRRGTPVRIKNARDTGTVHPPARQLTHSSVSLVLRGEVRKASGDDKTSQDSFSRSSKSQRSGFQTRWGRRLACLLSGRRDACPTFETASNVSRGREPQRDRGPRIRSFSGWRVPVEKNGHTSQKRVMCRRSRAPTGGLRL